MDNTITLSIQPYSVIWKLSLGRDILQRNNHHVPSVELCELETPALPSSPHNPHLTQVLLVIQTQNKNTSENLWPKVW